MIRNELFFLTIDIIPSPVAVTKAEKTIYVNKNFLDFFGFKNLEDFHKKKECICKLFLKHEKYFTLDKVENRLEWTKYLFKKVTNNDKVFVAILDKYENIRYFEIHMEKIPEYPEYYIIVLNDITFIQENEKLKKIAYYDFLTNIYNRNIFTELFNKKIKIKHRFKTDLTLLLLDIDYFKKINDTYGHDIGDKVLINFTKLISNNLRETDIFARWGGEEFMVLLPYANKKIGYEIAEKLRKLVEKSNLKPKFTISIGVTELKDGDNIKTAFKRVDEALYKAKEHRNSVFLK
jgi:diguanylate cyclase (GGDEF)-like protein